MTKWTKIEDAGINDDGVSELKNQPVFITDGSRVSYAKQVRLPFSDAEAWIDAEPGAENLSLRSQVERPTHFTREIGLPADAVAEAKERNKEADDAARKAAEKAPKHPGDEDDGADKLTVAKGATIEVKK